MRACRLDMHAHTHSSAIVYTHFILCLSQSVDTHLDIDMAAYLCIRASVNVCVCVAILYLRTLSGKVMFGLHMNDCIRIVGTIAKRKQGAGSLFRDASQRS